MIQKCVLVLLLCVARFHDKRSAVLGDIRVADNGDMTVYRDDFDGRFKNVVVSGNATVNGMLSVQRLRLKGVNVEASAAELNYLAQAAPGSILANKAVVYDADGKVFA